MQAPDPTRRQRTLKEAAHNAAQTDVDFEHVDEVAGFGALDFKGQICDANHLAAVDIDDLLIEQVARDAQHVFIVVIGYELFIAQRDAIAKGNGADLIVADGEPGGADTDQKAIDTGSMDQRDQGRVLDAPDAPALEVEDRHAQQFGEIEELVRHPNVLGPDRASARVRTAAEIGCYICALHGCLTPIPIWRMEGRGRKEKKNGKPSCRAPRVRRVGDTLRISRPYELKSWYTCSNMNQRFLILAFLACPLAAQVKLDDATYARIKSEELEHSQAMHTLHVLTDRYGPRLTGSPNFEDAANWVVKQMTEWGFKNAHLEPWDFGHPGWLNKRAEGYMVTPIHGDLTFRVLSWTPSTKGTVTASGGGSGSSSRAARSPAQDRRPRRARPAALRPAHASAEFDAGIAECAVEGERQDRPGGQSRRGAGEFRIRRALRRGEGDGRGGLRRTRRSRRSAHSRPEPHDRGAGCRGVRPVFGFGGRAGAGQRCRHGSRTDPRISESDL